MHGACIGTHVDDMHHIKAALKDQRYSAFMSAWIDICCAAAWTCAGTIFKKQKEHMHGFVLNQFGSIK
jgi:hypothetical protein